MKAFLSILFGVLFIFSSCENEDDFNKNKISVLTSLNGENGISYTESLDKWAELKQKNGNSYVYQTTFLSWTGFGSTTEIKVLNGQVTQRVYQEFNTDSGTGEREIIDSYTEDENGLGSHDKGASPLTIDELYSSCVGDYLMVDEENNTLYFEAEDNGLMTLCGFVPKGCVDDCFRGISIESLDWID